MEVNRSHSPDRSADVSSNKEPFLAPLVPPLVRQTQVKIVQVLSETKHAWSQEKEMIVFLDQQHTLSGLQLQRG